MYESGKTTTFCDYSPLAGEPREGAYLVALRMWRTLSRRHSPKYVPQQQRRYSGEVSLFALSYILGEQRRGVTTPVSRLEQTLNKPKVVLVVGVVAVALNILLYFGYFLPRMTPLIAHINPIGTSLPEAISNSDSKASSNSHPEDSSKSDSEVDSKSGPEAIGESNSEASKESGPEASGKSVPEESLASETDTSPDSPSGSPPESSESPHQPAGSPPELPPLPTPTEDQYE